MRKPIIKFLARHPSATLVVMTLCFLSFGYFSINIFVILEANIDLINRFGWRALADGAAIQFISVMLSALCSVFFYSAWKVCEGLIIEWAVRDAGQS